MTREDILERLFPDFKETKRTLDLFSDYELNLLEDNCPEDIDDLADSILHEVQWDIVRTLFISFINDWDDFYTNNEELVMDYCSETTFL